jgi:hypothetical protein
MNRVHVFFATVGLTLLLLGRPLWAAPPEPTSPKHQRLSGRPLKIVGRQRWKRRVRWRVVHVKDYHYRPFDIAFYEDKALFSPKNKVVAGLSLNLMGRMTGLIGLQVAWLLNTIEEDAIGLQVSAGGNTVEGVMYGIQVGGLYNVTTKGACVGMCAAGILNFHKVVVGIQVAGLFNGLRRRGGGLQLSAGFNGAERFNGLQVGTFNLLARDMGGSVQVAGFGNLAIRNFSGAQVGLLNWVHKDAVGVQIGAINVANVELCIPRHTPPDSIARSRLRRRNSVSGLQMGALGNVAYKLYGIQVGGLLNAVWDDAEGVQLAAGINTVRSTVSGVQIGLFNHARRVEGVQLGFLNVCEALDGVQIGVFNIATKNTLPFMIGANVGF